MKFFVPHIKRSEGNVKRDKMAEVIHDQLKSSISARRIYSLDYIHDKKQCRLEVGQLEQQERRYEVLAIFESTPFIVATGTASGESGPTILVSADEITEIVDFD